MGVVRDDQAPKDTSGSQEAPHYECAATQWVVTPGATGSQQEVARTAAAPRARIVRCLRDVPRAGLPSEGPIQLPAPGSDREGVPDMTTLEQQQAGVIQPFTVQIPEDALDDLRRRLAATRWPSRKLVGDR